MLKENCRNSRSKSFEGSLSLLQLLKHIVLFIISNNHMNSWWIFTHLYFKHAIGVSQKITTKPSTYLLYNDVIGDLDIEFLKCILCMNSNDSYSFKTQDHGIVSTKTNTINWWIDDLDSLCIECMNKKFSRRQGSQRSSSEPLIPVYTDVNWRFR